MSIVIIIKKIHQKKNLKNLIFFVDEKYNLSKFKKTFFKKSEYKFISDLLKSQNLSKKKIISFDISSKKKLILISIKKNIKILKLKI